MVKNSPANAVDLRDLDSVPGSGRSPGGGHGNPLQYSCLENPMDRGTWRATVHKVAKSRTQLKRLSMHISGEKVKRNKKGYKRKWGFLGGASGKEPACQCKRLKRGERWQPTPVFLPGESHGQRNLMGYSPWGRKELDTTEMT